MGLQAENNKVLVRNAVFTSYILFKKTIVVFTGTCSNFALFATSALSKSVIHQCFSREINKYVIFLADTQSELYLQMYVTNISTFFRHFNDPSNILSDATCGWCKISDYSLCFSSLPLCSTLLHCAGYGRMKQCLVQFVKYTLQTLFLP